MVGIEGFQPICEQYLSGICIAEISKEHGITKSTLQRRFKKIGILRSRKEAMGLAAKQGKLGSGNRGKKLIFTEEHKKKMSLAKLARGEKYAAGITKKPSGYIEFTRGPHKGRREHTVKMEQHIGRPLAKDEVVHHINEITDDNRLENLQLMTQHTHSKLHASKRKIVRGDKGRIINNMRREI